VVGVEDRLAGASCGCRPVSVSYAAVAIAAAAEVRAGAVDVAAYGR
jgi:hypothetical protein